MAFTHTVRNDPARTAGLFRGVANEFEGVPVNMQGQRFLQDNEKLVQLDAAAAFPSLGFPPNTVRVWQYANANESQFTNPSDVAVNSNSDVGKLIVDRSTVGSEGFFDKYKKSSGAMQDLFKRALEINYGGGKSPIIDQFLRNPRMPISNKDLSNAIGKSDLKVRLGQAGVATAVAKNPDRYGAGNAMAQAFANGTTSYEGMYQVAKASMGRRGTNPRRNPDGSFGAGAMNPVYDVSNPANPRPVYRASAGWKKGGGRLSGYKQDGMACIDTATVDLTPGVNQGLAINMRTKARKSGKRYASCGRIEPWENIPENLEQALKNPIIAKRFGTQLYGGTTAEARANLYSGASGLRRAGLDTSTAQGRFYANPTEATERAYKDFISDDRKRRSTYDATMARLSKGGRRQPLDQQDLMFFE